MRIIPLEFTLSSLREVLSWGAQPESSPYTHEEIAHWCDQMFMRFMDVDCDSALDNAISVAASVDCQWDLFLANSYSIEKLSTLDLSKVFLPVEWFQEWLVELNK